MSLNVSRYVPTMKIARCSTHCHVLMIIETRLSFSYAAPLAQAVYFNHFALCACTMFVVRAAPPGGAPIRWRTHRTSERTMGGNTNGQHVANGERVGRRFLARQERNGIERQPRRRFAFAKSCGFCAERESVVEQTTRKHDGQGKAGRRRWLPRNVRMCQFVSYFVMFSFALPSILCANGAQPCSI